MRYPLKHLGSVLACLALGGVMASAQQTQGFDAQFKLRTGYQLGGVKDHLTHRTLGFGLDFGYSIPAGRFSVEVGYQSKPGDMYDAGSASVVLNTTAVGTPTLENNSDYGMFTGDQRRNSIEGLEIRLCYETNFDSAWAFGGGVQLGGSKFKQEYTGNAYGFYLGSDGSPVGADWGTMGYAEYFDTYTGTPYKNKISISPFLSVSYKLNEQNSIALNLIGLSYTAIDYVHVAGTVDASVDGYGGHAGSDYLREKDRMLPHVELAYAFRF